MGFVKTGGISKLALTLFAVLFVLLIFSLLVSAQILIPCAKERKGCYKLGDGRVSSGTLTPSEFDYYLPQRQCIKVGNCDCAGDPESVTKEKDPDNSDEACSCLVAAQFDTTGKCCGDDKSDCGKVASSSLCSMDLDRTSGNWLRPDELRGDIFYTGCLAAEHFSDGKGWNLCNAELWKKNFSGHEYLCTGRGEGSIAECCGDGTCNSRTDGKRLNTGGYVNPAEYDNEAIPPSDNDPNPPIGFCKPLMEIPRCGDASVDPGCVCGKYERRQKYRGCEPTEQVCVPDYECIIRNLEPDCLKCTVEVPATCTIQVDLYRCIYNGTKIPCSTVSDCPSNGYKCRIGSSTDPTPVELSQKPIIGTQLKLLGAFANLEGAPKLTPKGAGQSEWAFVGGDSVHEFNRAKVYLSSTAEQNGRDFRFGIQMSHGDCSNTFSITQWTPWASDSGGWSQWSTTNQQDPNCIKLFIEERNMPAGKTIFDVRFGIQLAGLEVIGINPVRVECKKDIGPEKITNYAIDGGGWTDYATGESGDCARIFLGSRIGSATSITGNSITAITGNVVSSGENKRYYCNSDGKFITDLDVSKTTCENAGFTWTGSKCCGDQPGEYYNDLGGSGGCFNSFAVLNGEMLNVSNQSVFSSKGKFFGCQLDAKNFNTINDAYLSLKDGKTTNTLVTNIKYCNIENFTNNQCQFIEKFSAPSDATATNISFAPIPVPRTEDKAACCQATKCWNGTACIEDQSNKPNSGPIGTTTLRCIAGEWRNAKKKFTPDEDGSGYCPQDSQCLLSASAQSGNQCIENGEFSGDNYCNNGDWISRTGLVALEMIKIKGNADYSLFCDDRANTLNYIDYAVGNKIAAQILDEIGANSFCVLKTQSKTVLGSPIENKNTSINYGIFGVASCSGVADDGQFHSCDGSNRLWINKKSNVLIFSTSALSISSATASFDDLIKNPIRRVIDTIKRLLSKPPYDESYLTSIKKFRKLYMMQQGTKSIRGSIEGQDFKNLVIQYENFDVNICSLTDKYQKSHEDIYSGISCTNQGKNYYVLSQGSADTLVSPEDIWPDLTSKIRTK